MIRTARRETRALGPLACAVLALSITAMTIAGCNVIDVVRGSHASISKMVPGGNIGNGKLDCWITLEFGRYPDAPDLRDVRIRFESVALEAPAEFDWAYIASRDVVAAGSDFGSGHRDASETQPASSGGAVCATVEADYPPPALRNFLRSRNRVSGRFSRNRRLAWEMQ